MSSNLLVYSQIQKENERLKEKILEVKSSGGGGGTTWNPSTWGSLPMLNQATLEGALVVANNGNIGGCGATCTWTVPAGTTKAQFQVWGAGANGTGGECCGMGLPGANGAYGSIIIDVTPGDQYSLVAGCALCCCIHYGAVSGYNKFSCIANVIGDANVKRACASYVTGNGLTNFCAEGGMQWETCRWREAAVLQLHNVDDPATVGTNYNCGCYLNYGRNGLPGVDSCYGVLFGGSGADRGPWICNTQSQTTTVPMGGPICIPFVKECCSSYYGTTTGITGYYPAMQFNTGGYSQGTEWKMLGRFCFAPVHAEVANCGEWDWYSFHHFGTIGATMSCTATQGCVNYSARPGMHGRGGTHGGMTCAGQQGGGDRGYGGAVRVSWC